jgi:hypothetical protein
VGIGGFSGFISLACTRGSGSACWHSSAALMFLRQQRSLYALNTFGAARGAFVTGWLLTGFDRPLETLKLDQRNFELADINADLFPKDEYAW